MSASIQCLSEELSRNCVKAKLAPHTCKKYSYFATQSRIILWFFKTRVSLNQKYSQSWDFRSTTHVFMFIFSTISLPIYYYIPIKKFEYIQFFRTINHSKIFEEKKTFLIFYNVFCVKIVY